MSVSSQNPIPASPQGTRFHSQIVTDIAQDHQQRKDESSLTKLGYELKIRKSTLVNFFDWLNMTAKVQKKLGERDLQEAAKEIQVDHTNLLRIKEYFAKQNRRLEAIAKAENSPEIQYQRYRGKDGDEWQMSQVALSGYDDINKSESISINGNLNSGGLTILNAKRQNKEDNRLYKKLEALISKHFNDKELEKPIRTDFDEKAIIDYAVEFLDTGKNRIDRVGDTLASLFTYALGEVKHTDKADNRLLLKYLQRYSSSKESIIDKGSNNLATLYAVLKNVQLTDTGHGIKMSELDPLSSDPEDITDFKPYIKDTKTGIIDHNKIQKEALEYFTEKINENPRYFQETFLKPTTGVTVRGLKAYMDLIDEFKTVVTQESNINDNKAEFDFARIVDLGKEFKIYTNHDFFVINIQKDPEKQLAV